MPTTRRHYGKIGGPKRKSPRRRTGRAKLNTSKRGRMISRATETNDAITNPFHSIARC